MFYTTYGVDFRGVISGGGSIDKLTGSGGIGLYNPTNSFSGGLTIRATDTDWNKANVHASGAMGVGPVSLYGGTLATGFKDPGGLIFYNTSTQTNPISLFLNSPIFAGLPSASSDAVTLNGPIDLNSYTLYLRGGGAGAIGGVVSEGGANAIIKVDRGAWTLSGANTFTGRLTVANGTVKLGASGTLNPLVPVTVSCVTGLSSIASATLDLNGNNQTVSQLSGSITQAGTTNVLTSATAATLTVNQAATTLFNGRLTGALNLVKDGAGTLTLSNALSALSGSITVSNGTLAVALSSSLGNPAALNISSGSGAKVALAAGVTEPVVRLFLDGVQQQGGTYGAVGSGAETESDTYFSGSGKISVLQGTAVTWDGGGSDTLMSTAQNWVGDAAPAFKGNSVTFGTGGSTAVVDIAASLYGMTFNRDTNFVVAAGSGVITNNMGGILAQVPFSASRTYTVAEDLVLAASQVWNVTNNTAVSPTGVTALAVSGVIRGPANCTLTKQGNGSLTLSGDNSYDGVTTVNLGDLIVSHSNALGSTSGKTVVNSGGGSAAGGQLYLRGGITLAEPLELGGVGDGGYNGALVNDSGSNIVSGPITLTSSTRYQSLSGTIRISGGITGNSTFSFAYGPAVISGSPISIGTGWLYVHSGDLSLTIGGHSWSALSIGWDGIVRAGVANALPSDKPLELGAYDPSALVTAGKATLDLNGFSQSIGSLSTPANVLAASTTIGATRTIRSATAATFLVNQATANTFDGMITGLVSFVKSGPAMLTLSGTNTTYGSFTVSNGTLRVGTTGTLGSNCTNVVVAGGTLSLSNSVALSDSALVSIADGAKVELAAGVTETVSWLFYGNALKRAGTYGSTASTATVKDDTRFSGPGVLRVLHDKSGLLFRVQ
jgi:autotransporter-associated beta strand protein